LAWGEGGHVNHDDVRVLLEYNYWANRRVLEATADVEPERFTAPARLSHGSLRGALVHTLGAEVVWRLRCQQGISPHAMLSEDELPTLDALHWRWEDEEHAMRMYLASLTDDLLLQPVKYTTTQGVPFVTILWHALAHVVNHGTQFRGEAAVALTEYGHSPGNLDLIAFLRESGR
jgi:uncharacterized damage-inducible protein DinB